MTKKRDIKTHGAPSGLSMQETNTTSPGASLVAVPGHGKSERPHLAVRFLNGSNSRKAWIERDCD